MTRNAEALHRGTPDVMVTDNRGLGVREVAYHRHPQALARTDPRITRHRFNALGQRLSSVDPRLHEHAQGEDEELVNCSILCSFSGRLSRTDCVDAGTDISLASIDGRALLQVNGMGVTRRQHYEVAPLAGRLTHASEQVSAQPLVIVERFNWGDASSAMKAHNLAGLCVRHYDTAGCLGQDRVGITGVALATSRRLLKPGGEADWQGASEEQWDLLLSLTPYTTCYAVDATGVLREQIDAQGHLQRHAYDVAGSFANSCLTLKGGIERAVLHSRAYAASGETQGEVHGNGVVTLYSYEPRTQRLSGMRIQRPAGHAFGPRLLQDLHYEYDPVGNVLGVYSDAEATRFWSNQKVMPAQHCEYDTLYQLVSASGREMAENAQHNPALLPRSIPLRGQDGSLVNYVRQYAYDRGGNLNRISHLSPLGRGSYTRAMTVSGRSNRAVSSALTENPLQVDALFDAAGNQRLLQPDQALSWTSRQALQEVVLVAGEHGLVEGERYRYDGNRQRTEKISIRAAGSGHVLYLPALELRTWRHGADVTQALQVLQVGGTGRVQVRVLQWQLGLPAGIENGALRYSYGNLTASVGLELDGSGQVISREEYYPYGGTSVWSARNEVEAGYKTQRFAGKERDATGLYYFGQRYYQPWAARWLSADPAGWVDGMNVYRMVRNSPLTWGDGDGLSAEKDIYRKYKAVREAGGILRTLKERSRDFLESKKRTVTYGALFSGLKAATVSAGSFMGAAVGSVVPVVGTHAAGLVAGQVTSAIIPNYLPSPEVEVAKKIDRLSKPGALRQALDSIGLDVGAGGEEVTGNTFAETTEHTLMGELASVVPLVPVVAMVQIPWKVVKAVRLSKEDLVVQLEAELDQVESVLNGLIDHMNKAFEKDGRDLAFYPLPWSLKKSHAIGLRVQRRSLLSPAVVTQSRFNTHATRARAEIGELRGLIAQRNLGILKSHRHVSHHDNPAHPTWLRHGSLARS
ncbi:RHS repeat-associated core domain-containing protein [Pseudomonas putida]|uniref:RHS repeat protein n=1 Tax=Pseudomonas putida TaxID=303 RepID=A0A6I6XG89_PSEPU|nr:RHS repeat-associated core domain-containing protein [Pseudomonas putida]QHG64746.2 RHS repeat protein [Pseudomonas putida]